MKRFGAYRLIGMSILLITLTVSALNTGALAQNNAAQTNSTTTTQSSQPAQSTATQSTNTQTTRTTTTVQQSEPARAAQEATGIDPLWLIIGGVAILAILLIAILSMRGRGRSADRVAVVSERETVIKK
jgi:cytoskeletal protein RodZ